MSNDHVPKELSGWTNSESDKTLRRALLELSKLEYERSCDFYTSITKQKQLLEKSVQFSLKKMDAVISGIAFNQLVEDLKEYYEQ